MKSLDIKVSGDLVDQPWRWEGPTLPSIVLKIVTILLNRSPVETVIKIMIEISYRDSDLQGIDHLEDRGS